MGKAFFSFITVNLIAFGILLFNRFPLEDTKTPTSLHDTQFVDLNNITTSSTPYKFDDPKIAYQLLQNLDIFESELVEDPGKRYQKVYFGLNPNNNYCNDHRLYFVNHPEKVFEKKINILSEYWPSRLRNITLPSIGYDVHPNVFASPRCKTIEDMSSSIHLFFTVSLMHTARLVGRQFSCLTQLYNHCPGHESLSTKERVAESLTLYAKQYNDRAECFSTSKFFPETWIMENIDQCKSFFERFNSPEYFKLKKERNIVYIRKIAHIHQGNGVFPINDEEEKYVRELYANGTKCGEVNMDNVMQIFIHNPLLINNRKCHFRVFMFIASTNPFIAYYHDGYIRISFQEYDTTSTERETFVTNLGMTEVLFQGEGGVGNMSASETKQESYFFYPQFHQYLTEQGLVNDPNWLDNYLRKEIKKAMAHLVRMTQDTYWPKSSVSELYGTDFMMDDKFNLWFIEANPRPLMKGWDEPTEHFFDRMVLDSLELTLGLLRSRTKRIINYINGLTNDKEAWRFENEDLKIVELERRREEFKELSMNNFEPEFKPSSTNEFQLIVDENMEGTERYAELFEKECL